MSVVLFVLGWLLGLLALFGIPLLTQTLPVRARKPIADAYYALALAALGRVIAHETQSGDLRLHTATPDQTLDTETVNTAGDTMQYEDRHRAITRIKGTLWGIAYGTSNELLHPADAEVGRAWDERDTREPEWQTIQVGANEDGTPRYVDAYNALLELPDTYSLVDFRHAVTRSVERVEPVDYERTMEEVKNSQAGYMVRDKWDILLVVGIALLGMLAAWFIWSNTGGGGSSVVTIPIHTGWFV